MSQQLKNGQSIDFSKKAINKAIFRNTIEHPGVLYPGAAGLLGGIGLLALGPSALLISLTVGGAALASLIWAANFGLRKDQFANRYVKKLFEDMEKQRQLRAKILHQSLNDVDSQEGINQYNRLSEKFNTFKQLLEQKLEPGELTYGRYLGMAEQVYLGALDNLNMVANTLKSISAIDGDFLQKRLNHLTKTDQSAEIQKEIKTLQTRLALQESQIKKTQQLLTLNEEAMTQIDLTVASLTEMRTEDSGATVDLETAMSELQRLAHRAKDYSN